MGRLDSRQEVTARRNDFLRPADIMAHTRIDARRDPDIRWQLFDALKTGREAWGLKDRTLSVLHALLSFLPRGERVRLIVFPSNRCLSERLMGMPESTLRRHLAHLVEAGLIARKTSPNGKRYRVAQDMAYGFDLGPFFASGATIRRQAEAMAALRTRIATLRAQIRDVMHHLSDTTQVADLNRLLRRKTSEAFLEQTLHEITAALPPKQSASDTQNERHIDSSTEEKHTVEKTLTRMSVLSDTRICSERDLYDAGHFLAQANGLLPAWDKAVKLQGTAWASLCLIYVLDAGERIQRPNRYFYSLTEKAGQGGFDLITALRRTTRE